MSDSKPFVHLHVHSQYSILDGSASVKALVDKAAEDGMPALALTDHGVMFGIKEFFDYCKRKGVKPILGCEAYIARRGLHMKEDANLDRSGHHIVLLAKNKKGYQNLLKMASKASVDGFYYKPRIDKELLEKHGEGLIVCSACLGGEVARKIDEGDLEGAEEAVSWFKRVFGEDYYLEIQRHDATDPEVRSKVSEVQRRVYPQLIDLARKTGVKVVATNDVHFVNEEDAEAHDVLLCLSTGKDYDDPNRMRYTQQEWLKTRAEMWELFQDCPEALTCTKEVADKVEEYELDADPIMPIFDIPTEFGTLDTYRAQFSEQDLRLEFNANREGNFERLGGYDKVLRVKLEADYLFHLTMEGARKHYGEELTAKVQERIDEELLVIKEMGFPSYFLITQDFINEARNMGVLVGPGRGSAAGSVVSFCVGITNVDPMAYDLLFERFLNPDRISMPDVDVDFDDDGRAKILDWVMEKYGKDKVAHICTFGTMAAKMAIKDVARVLQLPLVEANRLAKLVPEAPRMTLKKAYQESADLLRERKSPDAKIAKVLRLAECLEGAVRQTGVHACGILIGRDPLDEHIPLMSTKGEEMLSTQYDGGFVESIGLLKMDFLGLKTLSIFKEALDNIKQSKAVEIDLDAIPLDDAKTFKLFCAGETTGVFQFESPGMKKHMRNLKPNRIIDLVAMNALYRPGPMEYIPSYIKRKHGEEEVKFDHPMLEPFLKDTYGVTVFQEQVMLLSRELGLLTRGESDSLRKAMGKKKLDEMAKLKEKFKKGCFSNPKFMDGCKGLGDPDAIVEKIWKDWEAFASYAFNKSHSVCYAHIAYQTAYLKANFPAEFMAGVLSRNLSDITKIKTFMEECGRMGLKVKGPDVNESFHKFTVNSNGEIRFGLAGIKGVGEAAVENIIEERQKHGPYKDIYDFAERVNLRSVNKRNWEALVQSGAFDTMGVDQRSQFFACENNDSVNFIEQLLRYGHRVQSDKMQNQNSLFDLLDEAVEAVQVKRPIVPYAEPWSNIEVLNREKELIGFCLSGHPLDDFEVELEYYCKTKMKDFQELEKLEQKVFTCGGIVVEARSGISKKGNPYGFLTVEDYTGSYDFGFFGDDFIKYSNYFREGLSVVIHGEVIRKRWGDKDLQVRVSSLSLLADLEGPLFASLDIFLDRSEFTAELMEDICELVTNNPGETKLYVNFSDIGEGNTVRMEAVKRSVDVNKVLVSFLKENDLMEFEIK